MEQFTYGLNSIETETDQERLELKIERFFQRDMALDVRQSALAQRILDNPQESVDWLLAFEDYLRGVKSIAILLERDAQAGHYRIARLMRKVPFAPLTTLVYDQVLESILPTLEKGESLWSNPDIRLYCATEPTSPYKSLYFEGNAASFVRYMEQLLIDGWDKSLARITQPDNCYYPIWECFEAVHNALFYTLRRAVSTARQQCYLTTRDNALVALELLTHVRAEYAEECAAAGIKPSAHGATLKAMRSADRIGWAATGNADSIGKVIGADRLAERFTELEACPIGEVSTKFAGRKRLVVPATLHAYGYNHPTMIQEPWSYERNCPAASWIESPDRRPVEAFSKHLTAFRRRYLPESIRNQPHEVDETLFIRSTLLLKIGGLVGYDTIFKDWVLK